MESKFSLNHSTVTTDISALKGKVISYLKLHVGTKNELNSCIIKFYNSNRKEEESAWLKLVKPGFNSSQVLIPDYDACFFVMEYDSCIVTDIYGTPIMPEGFTLHITEIAA